MPTFFVDPLSLLATAAGATFLTGLVGSPHCAVMCGPLACAGLGADRRTRRRAALAWHAGRVLSYGTVGAMLAAVGRGALALLQAPVARALPWVMAAGLVFSAFEVGRRLPALPGAARLSLAFARAGARLSPVLRAALRGAVTPFLPCGLLYGALVVAVGAGSAVGGAAIMIAFAAGAVPALALVQAPALIKVRRLRPPPRAAGLARRLVPLMAAAVVVARALLAPAAGRQPACHGAAANVLPGSLAQTLDENRPAATTGDRLR